MISISGYKNLTPLHQGNSFVVSVATDESSGSPVVLKHPQPQTATLEKITQLHNEYEILNRIDSDYVAKTYKLIESEGLPVMVMEYIEHQPLTVRLRQGPLDILDTLKLAQELASAIDSIHSFGVVYRNLNPDNILVDENFSNPKLVDFSLATFDNQTNTDETPANLEGMVDYMSPEQTGRMSRSVDYRSDIYSLGAVLYAISTGEPPFSSGDFLDLVYQHLAKVPEPASASNQRVPVTLDNIIGKLLVKEPEERYQSTYAVISDLKKATDIFLLDPDFSDNFIVALDDVPEQLSIPNRLYGRDVIVSELRDSIELALNDSPRPMTINGEPGTGKSALLRETAKLTAELGGNLCQFKASLVNKDVPLSSVIGLLTEISRQLLSRSDLSQLQGHLRAQLRDQALSLIEICPEMHRVLPGKVDNTSFTHPLETKAKIQEAFTNFIFAVADFTKPLVIAIDNAYWLDEGSLELLTFLCRQKPKGLFLVIAGRPNTGPEAEYFERFHDLSQRLHIGNLDQSNLRQLLAACTFRSTEEVEDFSLITFNKTQGNPHSVRQFLDEIYRRGLLFFNRVHREWSWDLDGINQCQPTSNVGAVLADNLSSLDKSTIEILKIASCIGDRFDLDTIKRVSGMSFSQTSSRLIQAVAEGFLLYTDVSKKSGYMFAHEQIQQSAYQMLDSIERNQIHAQIGRTYLTLDDSGDRIFEVVNQLNNSIDDTDGSLTDKLELARLNLDAGRKAKNSAAFQASFRYLRTALAVQGKNVWGNYELALETHLEAAEELDSLIAAILKKAANPLDKAKAYEIQMRALIAYNDVEEALNVGHEALDILDYRIPKDIGQVRMLINTVRSLLMARMASKVSLVMDNPFQLAAMRLLMIMTQAGYLASQPITAAYTLKMTELSIKGGLAPESSFAYPLFGALVIRYFGTINLGFEFGKLALDNLPDKNSFMFCRSNVIVHNFVSFWKQHLRASLEPLAEAERVGFEQGDIEFAQIAGTTYCVNGFIVGQDLNTLDASFKQKNDNAVEFNQTPMLAIGTIFQQTVQNLIKNPRQPWRLRGNLYDEAELIPAHVEDKDYTSLANVYIAKTFLALLFREFGHAREYSGHARLMLDALVSSPLVPFYTIIESLVLLSSLRDTSLTATAKSRLQIQLNLRNLRKWSHHAPMNVQAGYHLVLAEQARLRGQDTKAVDHYDQAIESAEKYGQTHLLALAQELTGRYYERKNQASLSNYFLLRARGTYVRWGAVTKVNALDREYRELAEQGAQYVRRPLPLIDSTEQAYTDHLDLGSVIKASQVLSGEIILETLLEKLMQVALENAGANSAGLVLTEGEELCVEILSRYNGVTTDHKRHRELIANCYELPTSVIQYVARTEEDLVLNDASNEDIFTQDAYIARVKPRSILCFPILSKSHLTGVLYLENLQTKAAFSEDRIAVLKLLASQSAIAIENAKLYQQLNESRNKYLSLYENAVEGIFEVDMNGELISVNPAAAQLMGYEDWINTGKRRVDFSQFYVDQEELRVFTRRLLSENRVVGFETRLKRLDQQEIWVAISAHVIFEDSIPIKIDGSIIDITERKRRQQAEQATRLAEAATETKSQFLANMSHEIRTPMNAILGYTRLALETSLDDQQSNYLQTIKNSSDHLLRVVNDILDISKIESGKLELKEVEFELGDVLKDVEQLFKLEAAAKQLSFFMPNGQYGRYLGDSVRLGQILINLISNAIKFTEQGDRGQARGASAARRIPLLELFRYRHRMRYLEGGTNFDI